MTAQDQSTASDGNSLIQQIALTNQVDVPWAELKVVLKQRLDQVLESKMLTYTEPTVTNPRTIELAPLPSSHSAESASSSTPASNTSSSKENTPAQPQERTDDQPNASNQIKETGQEDINNHNGSAEQEVRDVTESAASGPSPETKVEAQAEGQGLLEGSDDKNSSNNNQGVDTNGPTAATATTTAAAPEETAAPSPENGPKMVPVSKDTLLLETPEAYHERINALLNVFTSPPFTIQRVCELLLNPAEHHSNLIKYLRAVEKVLMITSSINEFSNPAYNGPSALDEDTESKKAAVTVNGDYSKAKALDFDLITDTSATPELTDANEQGTLIKESGGEDEKGSELQESVKAEESTGAGTSDMDVDTVAGAAAMDGVETEESKSGNVKLDSETDGGMDVDQP